jgi:hypothetical protein
MTKASAGKMIPQESKVKEIRDLAITEDPINLDMHSRRTIVSMDDPDKIIPHDNIPKKLQDIIIEMCGESYFLETDWTLKRLTRLSKSISHPRENVVNTLAQICGPKCSFMDICPYDIVGKAPAGERCPVELKHADLLLNEYLLAVSERLGTEIDELKSDMIVFNMIMGVVESDIISNRLNSIIANNGMIQQDPAAVDPESGRVWYKDEEAVAIKIKDRVNKRKDSLFEQLIATPEMQAKYRNRKGSDAISRISDVLDRIDAHLMSGVIDAEIVK